MTDRKTFEEQVRSGIRTILLMPFFLGYLALTNGFVLSKLWLWYAVPLGATEHRWQLFATGLLAYFVVRANPGDGRKETRSDMEVLIALVLALLVPWVALLLGWMWL